MTQGTVSEQGVVERADPADSLARRSGKRTVSLAIGLLAALAAVGGGLAFYRNDRPGPPPSPPPPQVTVGTPVQETVAATTGFLGQFSAVDTVVLRPQVGGILTEIAFQDGQIVHKGDALFVIDPRPFQIKLDQAVAQLQTAQAKATLSDVQLWRAQQLKRDDFGSVENVDSRAADQRAARAGIDAARAAIMDAQLDLEFSRVVAPFDGRIGAHLVSVGGLVGGSRGGSGSTTALASIVSLDPVYLDFDMSEADYLPYRNARHGAAQGGDVAIDLDGRGHFDRHGTLDFIDNAVNRSSGTIHVRATVPNPDFAITPGQFARLRVTTGDPAAVLLVPAASIVPDQSRQIVMTVAPDGTAVPKPVQIGDLYRGLRVIRSGLDASDHVVIGGLVRVRPGIKVSPVTGVVAPSPDAE